ncbi:hypothetical protein MNBD_NITROSPINAE01-80 [hydrothermal vent metagenome]|uniref:C1q domain-containing protein n=1 Tax=hydrothermal vent metagenome TaxID=652676 RepID=A0A3B1CN87_9ZZZZ
MPVQGYTSNRNLTKISQGSTDNWDVWYNDVMDKLDEPSILYQISSSDNLSAGEVAVVLDDGAGAKKAYLADSGTYTFGDPVGLVTETVTAGNLTRLIMEGSFSHNGWAFGAPDKLVYLSASGAVTATEPASGAVTLGFVLSQTSIYFSPVLSSGATGGQTNTVAGGNGIVNTGGNINAMMEPVYGETLNTVCEGNDPRLHTQNSDSGTSVTFFDINMNGNSARISTSGLNTPRIFTLPDVSTKLIGEASASSITGDHDYSGGVLRVPTNFGAPSGGNDEGDVVFDTGNDRLYVGLGASSWVPIAGGPAFSAHKNGTNQTGVASGLWTLVTFPIELFDTNWNFDTATGKFTPGIAGKYLVTACIAWTASTDTSQAGSAIFKNGLEQNRFLLRSPGTGAISALCTAIIDMNGSTDYLEMMAYQDTGIARDIDGTSSATYFMASKIA